jgi:uncharacterized RDD family membrane protein YckC
MPEIQQDILDDFVEQSKPATIGKRIGAALIDAVILIILFVIIGNTMGERYTTTTTTTTATSSVDQDGPATTSEVTTASGFKLGTMGTLVYMVCWFLLMPLMEGRGGQTIGKKALRIRVIRMNGDPTNVGISFSRHFFDFIDCFFLIGIIVASNNSRHRRVADNIAGTYVVDAM